MHISTWEAVILFFCTGRVTGEILIGLAKLYRKV